MLKLHARAQQLVERLTREERGDVPGWVLITLMTAGLVIIIWAIAGPALSNVFQQAISRVLNFGDVFRVLAPSDRAATRGLPWPSS